MNEKGDCILHINFLERKIQQCLAHITINNTSNQVFRGKLKTMGNEESQ